MKFAKIAAIGILSGAMVINQVGWADTGVSLESIKNTAGSAANEKKNEAKTQINAVASQTINQIKLTTGQTVNQTQLIANQMRSEANNIASQINIILTEQNNITKAGTARDSGWFKNAAFIVVSSLLIAKGDLNGLLTAIVLAGIVSIHLIGIDGQYLEHISQDSAQYNLLQSTLKKAANPCLPHIYLIGTVKPEYVDDIIKLTSQTGAIYEPAKTPINLIVRSIDKYISPNQRINISTISLPVVSMESARLNDAILHIISRVNFMSADESYINIRRIGNTMKVYHFDKITHKTLLEEVIPVSHLSKTQILFSIRDVIKNYHDGKIYKYKKHENKSHVHPHPINLNNKVENTESLHQPHRVNRRR